MTLPLSQRRVTFLVAELGWNHERNRPFGRVRFFIFSFRGQQIESN